MIDDMNDMRGAVLDLGRRWTVEEEIGSGGFGRVYALEGDDFPRVAKFVPKAPGSERELLFVDLGDAVNVVPVIDSGEHGDFWVLVMPRAEHSLRALLDSSEEEFGIDQAMRVLIDVFRSLESLEGGVVHRDIKPDNVLFLQDHWCLADFGIARYAEASTAPDTRKFALTPQYAAPERWRFERAASSTDIYSMGIMAYEMLAGAPPFPGPDTDDYRDQHLHENPPLLSDVPVPLWTLIDECLFKAPEARPTAAKAITRLDRISDAPASGGLADLAEANRQAVAARTELARVSSKEQTEVERRSQIADAGRTSFHRISESLLNAIQAAAPSVEVQQSRDGGWSMHLLSAELRLEPPGFHVGHGLRYGNQSVAFDVVLSSEINLRIPRTRSAWEGRSHSLWFCDAQEQEVFAWFETAFMVNPMASKQGLQEPFALGPDDDSAQAILPIVGMIQLAWPFSIVDPANPEEFIDRWSAWLAAAAQGQLNRPSRMPEGDGAQESFRRT